MHVFDLNVAGKLGRFGEIAALGTRLSVLGMSVFGMGQ